MGFFVPLCHVMLCYVTPYQSNDITCNSDTLLEINYMVRHGITYREVELSRGFDDVAAEARAEWNKYVQCRTSHHTLYCTSLNYTTLHYTTLHNLISHDKMLHLCRMTFLHFKSFPTRILSHSISFYSISF